MTILFGPTARPLCGGSTVELEMPENEVLTIEASVTVGPRLMIGAVAAWPRAGRL